jgi:MoaA/NifB/PqqE/SkfB family radical SAM enzyme
VIHEAQQVRLPVVTANAGGMAEFVRHEENGLLFEHRDPAAMARMMQRLVDDPGLAVALGARGYLHTETGDVLSMGDHATVVEHIYEEAIEQRRKASVEILDGPRRVTLDTNPDECNLSCVMCEEHSRHSPKRAKRLSEKDSPRRMSMETVRRVIGELAKNGLREVIPSTMGEPLLYDGIEEIIDLCAQSGVKLNLTTNGTFPRLGARRWAELVVPVGSDVKISLNGIREETQAKVMKGTKLNRILENAAKFIEVRDAHAAAGGNRCSVTFQMTFMEMNYRELPDLVRLAASMGVDRVKGHHVWVNFPELERESLRRSSEPIVGWNAVVREARAAAEDVRLPSGDQVRLDSIFELDACEPESIASDGVCPFLGQEAWVNTEGRYDPCCAPDDLRKTLGGFGNVGDAGLMAIWRGQGYRALCRTYMNRALCIRCGMRRPEA